MLNFRFNSATFLFVLVLILSLTGFYWLALKNLENELKRKDKIISSNLLKFDAELGRAHQVFRDQEELMRLFHEEAQASLVAEVEAYRGGISLVGVAEFTHQVSGGGNVKRAPNKPTLQNPVESASTEPYKPLTIDESWVYEDFRMRAQYEDEQFSYQLNQRFKALIVETDVSGEKPLYVSLWELDKDGNKILPPMELTSFEVSRLSRTPSFSLIDVAVDMGPMVAVGTPGFIYGFELGASLSSYGDSLRFVRVGGAITSDSPSLLACPVSWAPLDKVNLWANPCYYYNGNSFGGLSLSASF